MSDSSREASLYQKIYAVVRQIPSGQVATYGQVAAVIGTCTPRMVGYAMAALSADDDVPWQRVINRQGTISERKGGGGTSRQYELLKAEGIEFDYDGRVDFAKAGWTGPDWGWLHEHGFHPPPVIRREPR